MIGAVGSPPRRLVPVVAACLALGSVAPAAASGIRLDKASDYIVEAEMNGQKLRLRVDPGANGVIVLNRDAAERAGLRERPIDWEIARALSLDPRVAELVVKAETAKTADAPKSRIDRESVIVKPVAQLGPVRSRGLLSLDRARIAGTWDQKLFTWFDGSVVAGADGTISPAELPHNEVILELGPPKAQEKDYEIPVAYTPLTGFTFALPIRSDTVTVKFSPAETATIATAAAGAVIAETNGGQWAGESRPHLIAMNVRRPVRPMALAKPLSIKGMRIKQMLVRTADHQGFRELPADAPVDPDEIVVTARTNRQAARFNLTIGADLLADCSTITYNRKRNRLILRCPA